jgi:hypothetical protein
LLAFIAVLVAALGSALVLWRAQLEPGKGAAPPPHGTPELALPAPDAGVPPPIVPSPVPGPAPNGQAAAEEEAGPRPSTAYEPVPTSDDTDLSFARRAGLHRAPNPLRLTASVALALDGSTGEVLHARNELAILPIASLTKLLTAIVLLDADLPMSQSIRITRDDVDTLRNSRSRLRVGRASMRCSWRSCRARTARPTRWRAPIPGASKPSSRR